MSETQDNLAKNVLSSFLADEFRKSANNTLRLSLLYPDVRQATLIENFCETVLSCEYYDRLADDLSELRKKNPLSQREFMFEEIHWFETFLFCASSSGFAVASTPDSELIFEENSEIEFKSTIYNVKCENIESCSKLVDALFKECPGVELCALLAFLFQHLEFYL